MSPKHFPRFCGRVAVESIRERDREREREEGEKLTFDLTMAEPWRSVKGESGGR